MATKIKLCVFRDANAVAEEGARQIAEVVRKKPNAVIGLATGSTPEGAYGVLARMYGEGAISFAKVVTFNLDEYRGLDGDHEQSYRHFMNRNLFEKVDIRPWNTHLLNGIAELPHLECEAYEKRIIACGGVDLWLLGIGQNGHIAFNEPGSAVDCRTRVVSLTQSTIEANSDGRFFKSAGEVPRCALTAGIGTIRDARRIVLLATGEKKAGAVSAAINGPFSPDCPASLLQDHADCVFLCDEGAASGVKG